jgi:hypothetical protein
LWPLHSCFSCKESENNTLIFHIRNSISIERSWTEVITACKIVTRKLMTFRRYVQRHSKKELFSRWRNWSQIDTVYYKYFFVIHGRMKQLRQYFEMINYDYFYLKKNVWTFKKWLMHQKLDVIILYNIKYKTCGSSNFIYYLILTIYIYFKTWVECYRENKW